MLLYITNHFLPHVGTHNRNKRTSDNVICSAAPQAHFIHFFLLYTPLGHCRSERKTAHEINRNAGMYCMKHPAFWKPEKVHKNTAQVIPVAQLSMMDLWLCAPTLR